LEGFHYDPYKDYSQHPIITIGNIEMVCGHCQAKKFKSESPGICCKNGKVKFCQLEPPQQELLTYTLRDTSESKHFLSNIRKYNSCFQMASFGVTSVVEQPGFPSTFTVRGQIYYKAGLLLPLPNRPPKFLQLYLIGNEQVETEQRCANIPGTRRKLRVDEYIHLRGAVACDGHVENLGALVILPATFTASPRHVHKYMQDTLAYVRTYGRPDLFITFPCNPACIEIKENLTNGQLPSERYDLIANRNS
jgi:hypothetical protein